MNSFILNSAVQKLYRENYSIYPINKMYMEHSAVCTIIILKLQRGTKFLNTFWENYTLFQKIQWNEK